MFGFKGKILRVDLTTNQVDVINKDEQFYRKHLGGSFLAAKLFAEEIKNRKQLTGFSADNPIVFATGPLAGKGICGSTRVNVLAISPETPGIYTTQAGGDFGPSLKRAGYDALIVKGKAKSPVYLKIENEQVSFEKADYLWGTDRMHTYQTLSDKLGKKFLIASIGPAGENLIRHANIMFEPDHFAGRGGLGAVLGCKNLKAICVSGDQELIFKDKAEVNNINKLGARIFKQAYEKNPGGFLAVLKKYGTFGLLMLNQNAGNLPVKNFSAAQMEDEEFNSEISHAKIAEKYVGRNSPCKGCYVICKKKPKNNPDYTSLAEYENISTLGPNLGLTDLDQGLEACEICNRLGMDSISTGNLISFLMACYENGVISEDKYNYSIKFGDGKGACKLITDIAHRKGELANLLADGVEKACEEFGEQSRPYLRFSKGVGLPAHLPRVKPGVGFGYLHGPNPGDHMKLEHDWIASSPESLKDLGLYITSKIHQLDENKVEIARTTQIYFSAMDSLSVCMFIFGPGNILSYDEITKLINAATGFDYSFADIMKIGEGSVQLQKKLHVELGGEDEKFLAFLSQEIPKGPSKGASISEADFITCRKHYYQLWNWDEEGKPIDIPDLNT